MEGGKQDGGWETRWRMGNKMEDGNKIEDKKQDEG